MRLRLVTLTIALALLLPAAARADFQTLYDDYRADGVIDGCSYASGELSSGLGDIPADVREYDPGFTEAINTALEQVAAGCDLAPAPVTKNEVIAADGSPAPGVPRAVAFQAADTGRGLPGVLVGLIAMLGAALATAAVLALSRYYGWDLRGRLAPAGSAARRAERHLADSLRSVRDRLGF